MDSVKILDATMVYESPSVVIYCLYSEGMLCLAGSHESLKESDDWVDLFD